MAGTWGREEKKGNKGVQVRDIQRCRGKPRADQRASDPLRKGEDTNGGVWRPGRGALPALPGLTGDNSRRGAPSRFRGQLACLLWSEKVRVSSQPA